MKGANDPGALRFDGPAAMHPLAIAFRAVAAATPQLVNTTLEAAGLDGLGLAVQVKGLPAAAYKPEFLHYGMTLTVGILSGLGEEIWNVLQTVGQGLVHQYGAPGDVLVVITHPSAAKRARDLFRQQRAA